MCIYIICISVLYCAISVCAPAQKSFNLNYLNSKFILFFFLVLLLCSVVVIDFPLFFEIQ